MPEYTIRSEDVKPLLKGLSLFGTGGGGAPGFGKVIMENDFARGREYVVVDPADVPDSALVVSGGLLCSVKAADEAPFEKVVQGWETRFGLLEVLRAMEKEQGRKVDYLVPFELGGLNTPAFLSLGARSGIPVINGDALGRAAPETQMTTFLGHGIALTPMTMIDDAGNLIVVSNSNDSLFPDRIGRWLVTEAGGMGANNHYPMSGQQMKTAIIPQTISMALEVGKAMANSGKGGQSKAHMLAEIVGGRVLLECGVIQGIEAEDCGGFLRQRVIVTEKGKSATDVQIVVKNEAMLCLVRQEPACIFPDLIMLVDPTTGDGIMSSELRDGRELGVVLAPCHPRLREALCSSQGREAFSPARYGYEELEYTPLEDLSSIN
jgi:DUF917 family protein